MVCVHKTKPGERAESSRLWIQNWDPGTSEACLGTRNGGEEDDGGGPQCAVSERTDTERPRGRCRAACRITCGGVGPGCIQKHLDQSIKVSTATLPCEVPKSIDHP